MIKPYALKKQANRDPNSDEAKPRVKIRRKGMGSYIEADLEAALCSIGTELAEAIDGGELEDELILSIVMLSDEAVQALPEFQGW